MTILGHHSWPEDQVVRSTNVVRFRPRREPDAVEQIRMYNQLLRTLEEVPPPSDFLWEQYEWLEEMRQPQFRAR